MTYKILDSCIIIDFVKGQLKELDLPAFMKSNKCAISFITKLETLGYSAITTKEEADILTVLSQLPVIGMTPDIETETIQLRRKTNLKLPDAIIAATAIVIGAEIVTNDAHFFKCAYQPLCIYQGFVKGAGA